MLFTLTHGALTIHPVGLNMSVLRRCEAFAQAGIENMLLINSFQLDFPDVVAGLRDQSKLNPKTSVRSMYEDLAGPTLSTSEPDRDPLSMDASWNYEVDPERPQVSRGYQNGKYRLFIWRKNGKVYFIDHLNDEKKRVSRLWYDQQGRLRKREAMDQNNKPESISFFTIDGDEFLRHRCEDSSVISIELFRKNRGSFKFKNEKELLAHWLSEHIFRDVSNPVLISEYGFNRSALENLKYSVPGLRVIYTLHNNHYSPPYRYGSSTKPELVDFMDHLADYDAVVVLTNEQRLDIMKEYAPLKNVHVIPHHVPDFPPRTVSRDPMKVVLVGRYTAIKGQLDAIEAFRKVTAILPQARLELYGRGPDEDKISAAIVAAGLESQVRVMGFTENSLITFEGAALSLMPSYMEGYPLSLQESMASGCVPVAYDYKYGARAQISNGKDGVIVDTGNTKELAAAVVLLLTDSTYRMALSAEARKCNGSPTQRRVVQLWNTVFDRLVEESNNVGTALQPNA